MDSLKLKSLLKFIFLCFFTRCMCDKNQNNSFEFGNRILSGLPAKDYQFPYQVSLQKHKKHLCGGSIISEAKVLTAAHCVTNNDGNSLSPKVFRILAGTNKLIVKESKYFYSLKGITTHPEFDGDTLQCDYAIVFISRNFDFASKRLSIIPLAMENPPPGTECYVSGWGDISTAKKPNELQFAKITVDPPEECRKVFEDYFLYEIMVCAGQTNKENAGCGDSGGPLCCNNKLHAVVSFGKVHNDPELPDVYSSVAYVNDWIKNTNETPSRSPSFDGFHSMKIFSGIFFIIQAILSGTI